MVAAVEEIVEQHTAGSPMNPDIRWTNRSPSDICEALVARGFYVWPQTVRRILQEDLDLGLRQACKIETTCHYPDRNAQFEYIAELRERFHDCGRPVLSIDTKKKEKLGDFYRPGAAWTDGFVTAPDHDFPSQATGKLTPYGVYDVGANQGFMLLSTGADTAELACEAVRQWWCRVGQYNYRPRPREILLLCDCGGSNSYRQYLFKQELKHLAMRLKMTIRVAHYPPGCSKYNPIEHRMFCHVSRSLRGVILDRLETAAHYIGQTRTLTGLKVLAEKARQIYVKAQKATTEFLERMPIFFDKNRPELNYWATPCEY
ncbi:ISAzo13 family transposase [Lignipirellula cremea]|nr:ISAzo13 family transposase [Lignipirellula cremea]